MKPIKAILIILLTTATLAAATERKALWTDVWAFDPETLDVIYEYEYYDDAYYGTAYDDGYLWHRTLEQGVVNYYYKVNLEGEVVSSFPGPDILTYGSRGIDVDEDGNLWISYNNYIYHVTDTGTVIGPTPFHTYGSYDIAWDGNFMWTVDGGGGAITIYKYNVNTGAILDVWGGFWGLYPRYPSLAADADYLYLTYENKYDYEPPGYYWVLRKDGTTELLLDEGWRLAGWDVAEHSFTSIEPTSLGKIKAHFK